MRRILLAAAAAVTTYRDSSGHIIGTGTTDSSSTTTFMSETCYSPPIFCSLTAIGGECRCNGGKNEPGDLFSPETRGLGINPDGGRGPFPPGYRAPQKR